MNVNTTHSHCSWPSSFTVDLSIGTRHADVTKQLTIPFADWLQLQTGQKREGIRSANEYISAEKKLRDADKAMASPNWFSFAHYKNLHRSGDNWQGTNVVVLDADAKKGKEEGAQYAFTHAQLMARLQGLQYAALPTHSYTDQVPRWRIAIPLSEQVTNRDEFRHIAIHLAQRLDGIVDPRSGTPEQYWFFMSCPRGEWDNRHKLVMVGEGEPADVAAILAIPLPEAGRHPHPKKQVNSIAAAILQGNAPDFATVKEMLRFIDPFTGRDEWRNILFALASTYGSQAEELARSWSRGELWLGGRYVDQ